MTNPHRGGMCQFEAYLLVSMWFPGIMCCLYHCMLVEDVTNSVITQPPHLLQATATCNCVFTGFGIQRTVIILKFNCLK